MRSFNVLAKGVVVVPNATRWTGPWLGATRRPSLQRVANRPIVCHVLDALAQAGVVEVAVLAPPDALRRSPPASPSEGPAGDRRQLPRSTTGAARARIRCSPPRSSSATLHAFCIAPTACWDSRWSRSSNTLAARSPPTRCCSFRRTHGEIKRLRLVPQRLLTADGEDGPTPAPEGVAGVCLLGPGTLRRLAESRARPHRRSTSRAH